MRDRTSTITVTGCYSNRERWGHGSPCPYAKREYPEGSEGYCECAEASDVRVPDDLDDALKWQVFDAVCPLKKYKVLIERFGYPLEEKSPEKPLLGTVMYPIVPGHKMSQAFGRDPAGVYWAKCECGWNEGSERRDALEHRVNVHLERQKGGEEKSEGRTRYLSGNVCLPVFCMHCVGTAYICYHPRAKEMPDDKAPIGESCPFDIGFKPLNSKQWAAVKAIISDYANIVESNDWTYKRSSEAVQLLKNFNDSMEGLK